MKQIPILSGKAMIVEMPEGASDLTYPKIGMADLYFQKEGNHAPEESYISVPLPPGNWRIIGMLSEVTEEQARQIARHRKHNTIRDGKLAERLMFYNHTTNIYGQATALESLDSAIEAAAYTFSNPYGEVEPKYDGYNYNYGFAYESPTEKKRFERDFNDWQAAQSRVLDRSRCLLLGREGL